MLNAAARLMRCRSRDSPVLGRWGVFSCQLLLLSIGSSSIYTMVVMVIAMTLTGAGSAAGSLALARRADDRELLEHGADVADIGLTEEEKRELLAG